MVDGMKGRVQQIFPLHITQNIMVIPLSQTQQEDLRIWMFDSKGKYLVRDGYKVALGFFDPPATSSEHQSRGWWQFLWSLNIPPKVRIFWWRVLHDIIPTSKNLLSHHVPVAGTCPLCCSSCDSTTHALFFCVVVKSCWKDTRFWVILKQMRHLEIFDIFLWMKDTLSRLDFEVFVMRSWATWCERLCVVHKSKGFSAVLNVDWSESLLGDFRSAWLALKFCNEGEDCKSADKWIAPPINCLRIDVDAAYNENQQLCLW
ncbi:uncharacterized protein [Henckelia pumila]|uniref:uncharacterized protein n=1 Tax=Henckelia pumila TaxID=405737 RepID=UPI003C6E8D86